MFSGYKKKESTAFEDRLIKSMTRVLTKHEKKQLERFSEVENTLHKLQIKQNHLEILFDNIFTTMAEQKKRIENLEITLERKKEKAEKEKNIVEDTIEKSVVEEPVSLKERILVGHIIQYDEVLQNIRSFMEKQEAFLPWVEQIQSMMSTLKNSMELNELVKICDINSNLDYSIHEVIETVKTSNKLKKDMLYSIILPGWRFQNEVIQKAKVIAYQYELEVT